MPATRKTGASRAAPTLGVRERIIAAAFELLQDAGLQSFTQVNVAERAGVRQSHLTYYFPTRQDLLEGVTAEFVAGVTRAATRAVESSGPAAGEEMLAHLAAKIADASHTRMFLGMIIEADGDPTIRAMIARATRAIEAALTERMGGRNAEERARVVLAAMWGLGLYEFVMRPGPKASMTTAYLARLGAAVGLEAPPIRRRSTGRTARK